MFYNFALCLLRTKDFCYHLVLFSRFYVIELVFNLILTWYAFELWGIYMMIHVFKYFLFYKNDDYKYIIHKYIINNGVYFKSVRSLIFIRCNDF